MFGRSKGGKMDSGITLIATNCEIAGDIHFSDQLLVNGIVKGNIYAQAGSKAVVTISEKGRVKGEIRVPNVIVNGKVYGDIKSDKHVELAAKAEVKGNVYYNLIEMVMGSRVDGNLVHIKDAKVTKPSAGQENTQKENNQKENTQKEAAEPKKSSPAPVTAVKSKSA